MSMSCQRHPSWWYSEHVLRLRTFPAATTTQILAPVCRLQWGDPCRWLPTARRSGRHGLLGCRHSDCEARSRPILPLIAPPEQILTPTIHSHACLVRMHGLTDTKVRRKRASRGNKYKALEGRLITLSLQITQGMNCRALTLSLFMIRQLRCRHTIKYLAVRQALRREIAATELVQAERCMVPFAKDPAQCRHLARQPWR